MLAAVQAHVEVTENEVDPADAETFWFDGVIDKVQTVGVAPVKVPTDVNPVAVSWWSVVLAAL